MIIARLIAEPASLDIRCKSAVEALAHAGLGGARVEKFDSSDDLVEFRLPHGDPATFRSVIESHFAPSDLLVSDAEIALPQVLVSDMDSTMIGQECIDELADFAGIKPKIAEITERAMRGELDFAAALTERVGLLEGLDEAAIGQCLAERISPTPGAKTLVATLKAKGCRAVLVTGGFHHFADAVAKQLGFDDVIGNRLEIAGGKLTGGLVGPISDSSTKQQALHDEAAKIGAGAVSLALGDGANDVPMLQAATYGLAYRAKPTARIAAGGWIDHGDLTSVLRLLGIAQSEWAKSE